MTNSTLAIGGATAWLAIGLVVGGALLRRGEGAAAALAAVVVWPAMVSLLASPPALPELAGPYGAQITAAFAALRAAAADAALAGVLDPVAITAVEAALRQADLRLAAADRLLADPAVATDDGAGRLVTARAHAAEQIEATLRQLVTVRVQLGLVALAGDTGPVRAHLAELGARAGALAEVAC